MSEDKLISPPVSGGRTPLPAEHSGMAGPPAYDADPYYRTLESEGSSVDWRRYAFALWRYKWLLALSLVVGMAGAVVAWRLVEVNYTAEGHLWIEGEPGQAAGDVAPIRASGLLESNELDLLTSYAVLDSVSVIQRLYVETPMEFQPQFTHFALDSGRLATGDFELRIGPDGDSFALASGAGVIVQQGRLGEGIGAGLGFRWAPPRGSFPAGGVVPFTVLTPRDAARDLSQRLVPRMGPRGNVVELSLDGTNPARIAAILNEIMDRYVRLAAELKRAHLDETLVILEAQLQQVERELAEAEQELEVFRVTTISLPSDRSTPIAAGLQITRDPVFSNFFDMRIELEQLARDRARLEAALDGFEEAGTVQIEALEVIPAAQGSSELRRILDELVEVRSSLRVLQDRYADDYPPIQALNLNLQTIENRAIPRVVGGILEQLVAQETDMQRRVDAAAADLEAIPPRTIEEGRLERRVTITENLYNELRSRVETARLAAASSIPDVRVLDTAEVPQRPTDDARLMFAAAVLFGCLGAALGGALLLDRTDARFRYASDVSRDIGLDILGSVPRIQAGKGKRGVLNAAQALEAFRELRIHIGFAYGSAGPITLTVSSPSEGEGKSLIASNLAVAFAEVGRRTLLIDGDTRRGDAHRLLGLEQSPGLIDYLRERSGQEIIQATQHDNLDFIGCGSRGSTTPELLASSSMAYFMGTLKRSYDVIIVDSPPLASGGDPLILSTLTGNLAVVIRTGTTERQLAQAKLDQLSRLPIRILGAILNDVDPTDAYHYYYSAYLPGYEPVPDDADDEEVQLISGARS